MKTIAIALLFLAAFASAEENNNNIDLEVEETPRFTFVDLTNNAASLSLNSTSLQYAVITGIVLLLVAIVVVPLLGYDLSTIFTNREDYDYSNYAYDGNQAYSSYSAYAKRSLDLLSPVLKALTEAYQRYE
ncbi:uncharacterized protein [Palaemon carinicauda]|uniref:uncharacterized protein n=1 Tax=Palaemon carinicauda TaxID=392227 RepID=UPI0035B58643